MELEQGINEMNLKDHRICGDNTNVISELKFEPELEELIKNIIKKEGFVTSEIDKKVLSNIGGNYLGILYEVNITGDTVNGKHELNLFLKKIIMGDKITFVSVKEAYRKEMYVYNELSKIFEEMQEDANIPKKDRFDVVKCYGVLRKPSSETIILENMTRKGYKTCDRLESISLKFAELSVADLAKFHALGYVLERNRPKYFESEIKTLKTPFNIDEEWIKFAKSATENTLSRLNNNLSRNRLKYFIENKMLKNFKSYYNPTKFSTTCHGDFRANNILVKIENGEMIKTKVIDYQLIYYGCPLNDFLYFIFGATDQKFRRYHLDSLKILYHDTLKRFLKYFNFDVEHVYPRKEFEKEYRERLDYGLIMALQVLPFILASEGDVPDFEKIEITEMKLSENEDVLFKERMFGILDDFTKWGYL